MMISIFHKVGIHFNLLKSILCPSKSTPKGFINQYAKAGKQIGPYSQQLFLIKNPATSGFLKLQTGSANFKKSDFIPPLIAIKTFQSQFPESIYHYFIHK